MKAKKIAWSIVAGLLVLAAIALIVVAVFLDGIVKKGVETVGPKITGVSSVKLDDIHISLFTGSARIKGLVVGNPDGYKTPNAISVGLAEVSVDPLSIMSDKIVVHSIHVESPEITFEGGLDENNLGKIMDNVDTVSRNGGPAPAANSGGSPKPAKKIEVDDLFITGAKVHVSLTMLGGKEMTLTLPEIHLTNLGKGGAGLTATDLTRAVLQSITSATIKAVTGAAVNVGGGVKKLGGAGVNKLKSGLGGLLGK